MFYKLKTIKNLPNLLIKYTLWFSINFVVKKMLIISLIYTIN